MCEDLVMAQEAATLLEYCLSDIVASDASEAVILKLAGLHIVPLLSGQLTALQPSHVDASPVFLATAEQMRVLGRQSSMLLHCEVRTNEM